MFWECCLLVLRLQEEYRHRRSLIKTLLKCYKFFYVGWENYLININDDHDNYKSNSW